MIESKIADAGNRNDNPRPSTQHLQHDAQFERQGEVLRTLRSHKQDLVAQGVKGWDLMEAMTSLTLNHKESVSQHRCQNCWLDPPKCICPRISKLLFENNFSATSISCKVNVKLLILMHSKEHFCAGNSARLLRMVLPNNILEYYIFGRVGDVDRLGEEMSIDLPNTMILWPDKDAISISQFLEQQSSGVGHMQSEYGGKPMPLIRAVVLDGTYTQARNMHTSLRKRLVDQPLPVSVQLRPMNSSVFHRAQKNYGQAHKQQDATLAQRISTAESCGLLLTELGAPLKIKEMITHAVIINNEALGNSSRKKKIPKWQ